MLSIEEVKHIAQLARIGLEEEEIEKFRTDLSAVLDSFRELEQADVEGVPAFDGVPGVANALREDVSKFSNTDDQLRILSSFPRKDGRSLTVKSVF
ncbi:MAG: Asp-tRNA(Asn)/Glu-tRNA(Gln) amidotransferase subunit GatC [Candidatus Moraniibacteriota bacterium]|nr:MAG: Asp-tRNA(Asn)/Glu-tRNA(Gln) amidotransferase subunit GatC [Candidatus Moranbacteria bacterium]